MSIASEYISAIRSQRCPDSRSDEIQMMFAAGKKQFRNKVLDKLLFDDGSEIGVVWHQNAQLKNFYLLNEED